MSAAVSERESLARPVPQLPRGMLGLDLLDDSVELVGRPGVFRQFVGGFFGMAAALTLLGSIGVALSVVLLHVTLSPVLSGSMRPTFQPGSALVTLPISTSEVRRGDVVVFQPPGEADSFSHRVVTVTHSPGGPVITTRGDANRSNDPWHAQLLQPKVQRVAFTIPGVGYALVALHQPRTRPFALGFCGLFFTFLGARVVLGINK